MPVTPDTERALERSVNAHHQGCLNHSDDGACDPEAQQNFRQRKNCPVASMNDAAEKMGEPKPSL